MATVTTQNDLYSPFCLSLKSREASWKKEFIYTNT